MDFAQAHITMENKNGKKKEFGEMLEEQIITVAC